MSEENPVNESNVPEGAAEGGEFNAPLKDPWKMFRGVMAGMLVLQGIVVLLALPVVSYLSEGLKPAKLTYVVALGLLLLLGAGLQGRSWAIPYNLALQVLAIAAWWVYPELGVVGIVFAALWAYLLYLRGDIVQRQQHGLLPGQRDFGQDS